MKKYCLFICLLFVFPIVVDAKRGCCSWHGGVSHCAENGRYVCNDGTYSPTCTCAPAVTYRYGCTNPNAINYDSSANRDDGSCILKVFGCMNSEAINYNSKANVANGSCKFEIIKIREVEIDYDTIIEKGSINEVKQEGKKGIKKLTVRLIEDEYGNLISSEIIDTEIVEEPVDEIIVEYDETLVSNQNDDIKNDGKSSFNYDGIYFFAVIGLFFYGIFMIRKNIYIN